MKRSTKEIYVEWLMTYKWDWDCTMNFRNGIRRKSASRLWRAWIGQLEKIEGHRLRWARMGEVGKTSGKFHFQGAVAGVKRTSPEEAAALWLRMAGDAMVRVVYFANGWIEYMLKEMEGSDDYDFDAELLEQHRPRKKLSTKPSGNLK